MYFFREGGVELSLLYSVIMIIVIRFEGRDSRPYFTLATGEKVCRPNDIFYT